ncbi:MAG: hypothetical protein ACOYJY_00245 [Acutalibacteraceae bacterium]|jgi:hypothetical protein
MAFGVSRLSDDELFRKVLLIFPPAQLVLGLILYAATAANGGVLVVLFVLAGIGYLLARLGWESRGGRIAGRILWLAPPALFLTAAGMALAASDADFGQGWMMLGVNALVMLHTLSLFWIPSMAVAALNARRWDVTALRIACLLQLALGIVMDFPLAGQIQWGVDNVYFRLFCLACAAAVTVTAFLIPPAPAALSRRVKKSEKTVPTKAGTIRNPDYFTAFTASSACRAIRSSAAAKYG